jgi:hypothetical protein
VEDDDGRYDEEFAEPGDGGSGVTVTERPRANSACLLLLYAPLYAAPYGPLYGWWPAPAVDEPVIDDDAAASDAGPDRDERKHIAACGGRRRTSVEQRSKLGHRSR